MNFNIISIISILISSLSLIISVFILLEMRKQRIISYRPQLSVKNKKFFLQKNSNGIPCIIKENYEKEESIYCSLEYKFELNNIGLAAAREIKVKWEYDLNIIKQKFEEIIKTSDIIIKDDKLNHYLFKLNDKSKYGFEISPSEKSIEEINFIRKEDFVEIKLPETIINYILFYSYYELKCKNKSRESINIDDFNLSIEFKDVYGKKYSHKIKVKIDIYLTEEEFENDNYGWGKFKFSLIK